jgi:DNA repair protein RecN (Recombination protein N)
MLKGLSIQNYALIEDLKMTPSPQLNIITGETGAGKSIMLGAVGLMLGNRADTKSLLNEEKKCIIEGTFDLSSYSLQPLFLEEDLDYEDVSIIRREISPNGKSRAFVNDTPVTLETLKKIGLFLMDVHSQHDSLLLTTNTFQLQVIDFFAGNQALLENYGTAFKLFQKAKKNHEQLTSSAAEIKKAFDYNNFLLEELVTAKLDPEEQNILEEELEILENSEDIKIKLHSATTNLQNGEPALLPMLHEIVNHLRSVSRFSESYETLYQRTESCLIELKDITNELETAEELVAFDPEKILKTKERLSLVYQLQQKHQVKTVEELLLIQRELQNEVEKVLNLDDELRQSKEAVDKAEVNVKKLAQELSEKRLAAFKTFEEKIVQLVRGLGMPDASFVVIREETPPANGGIDEINFLFSANKGIKPQSLKTAASGGEFSRLMFCIKYILADKTALPTIVFDEIDTGISGEIALKMVNMMKQMAHNHQVIAISHLPQIAAKGDTHYFVYKDNSASKTISKIRMLSEEERIIEIAKMIGGENPSAVAYESAKELMVV